MGMNVIVDNDICISNCEDWVYTYLKARLTVRNPEYDKKVKMNKWVGDTPKHLSLIEKIGDNVYIPFGCLRLIFANSSRFERVNNKICLGHKTKPYLSKIEPYEYQQKAIDEALKKRNGVIIAPCSSGKTQIGLQIASILQMRVLWLTHTGELLKQSMDRAKSVFDGLSGDDYGTITAGQVNVGKVMTFATVQTMAKIDLTKLKNAFDVIIVDECHHAVGTPTKLMMFYKVVSSLSARYKIGLTATPKRTDGLETCMFALLGEKIHQISKSEIANTSCDVKIIKRETGFDVDAYDVTASDGTLSYTMLINEIVEDEQRNRLIIQDVANANGSCLVLTDRVKHLALLQQLCAEVDVSCEVVCGSGKREDRAETLQRLADGNIKCVCATYQLAKEGLDIRTLQNVFFATPQKNDITVTQSAGRVARACEGKKQGVVYDYVDEFGMLRGWAKKRERIYKKLDYEIGG